MAWGVAGGGKVIDRAFDRRLSAFRLSSSRSRRRPSSSRSDPARPIGCRDRPSRARGRPRAGLACADPGRSITPSGSGGTGPRSNRRTIVSADPGFDGGRPWPLTMSEPAGNSPGRPLELDRDRMGQVAGERRRHRQPRRVAEDPFAAEREMAGRFVALVETGSSRMARAIDLVPGRVGERQDGVEAEDRVEIEVERDVRQLDLPGAGEARAGGPGSGGPGDAGRWSGKSSGMIENSTRPRPGLPRRRIPPSRRGGRPGCDATTPGRPGRRGARSSMRNGTSIVTTIGISTWSERGYRRRAFQVTA